MKHRKNTTLTYSMSSLLLGHAIFSPCIAYASPNLNSKAYSSDNIFAQNGYKGQCTWFTYGRVLEKLNLKLPSQFYGNAIDWWYSNINSKTYSYGQEPRENSIVVWSGGSKGCGHVGFIEKVQGDTVYYNEGNVEHRGNYDGHIKTSTKEQIKNRGNLFLKGYIYLNQKSNSPSINNNNNDYKVIKNSKVHLKSSSSSLNVRNIPSINSNIIGSLSNNQIVSIISENDGWSKIKYGSSIGYISSRYLLNNTNSSNQDSSSNLKPINTGYVKLQYSNSSLNVRNSNNTASKIIGSLKNNSAIKIIEQIGDWYKIQYDSSIGYVSKNYISTNSTNNNSINISNKNSGIVSLSNKYSTLNVRKSPSTNSRIISTLAFGTRVDILSKSENWYKIKSNDTQGYVYTSYIK